MRQPWGEGVRPFQGNAGDIADAASFVLGEGGSMQAHSKEGKGRHRRLPSFAIAVLVWLGLGLTAPVLVTLYSSDLALQDTVVAAPRDTYAMSRQIVLSTFPLVTVDRGNIIALNAAGKPTSGAETDAMLSAGSANLVLDGATFSIAAQPHAVADDIRPLAPLVTALVDTRYEVISIRRGAVLIGLGGGHVELLTDVHANASLKRKGLMTAKGNGILRGQRVDFDLTVGLAADRKTAAPERLPLKLNVKGGPLDVHFDGRMSETDGIEIVGGGEVSIGRVRQLARWFGVRWPTGPGFGDFHAKGQVELKKQTLAFERAAVRMDGNDANGTIALGFAGPRPMISGTLAFKSLNASHYFAGRHVAADAD